MKETDLYAPVKAWLEALGFEVKAEVGPADVMACREDAEPVYVELKTGFSLTLFHQGIARQKLSEQVYLAVPVPKGGLRGKAWRDNVGLARRLGLGVLAVRLRDGRVDVAADPGPYRPRMQKRLAARMLGEFAKLSGDPNLGGMTRAGRVTAYRQDALRCARHLAEAGPCRGAVVAKATGVGRATTLMASNHYGWFERVERGIYGLTEAGAQGLDAWQAPGAITPSDG